MPDCVCDLGPGPCCDDARRREYSRSGRHDFHGLWVNFGPHGRQDVHYHPCADDDCSRVVLGPGRDCDADGATHWGETL